MNQSERATMQAALDGLESIVNANPRKWQELSEPVSEFERWAKSRANHAAIKLRAALAQPDTELQLAANLLQEYGLQALDVVEAFKQQPDMQAEPVAWFRRDQLQHIGGGGLVSAYPNTDNRTDLVPLYATPPPQQPAKEPEQEQYYTLRPGAKVPESMWRKGELIEEDYPMLAKDTFTIRDTLASLKCWHRLTGEEADDLVRFFTAKELSDEEIRKLQAQYPTEHDPMPFARAVEAKVRGGK